jgi:2'-5' RNA ligase
VLKASQYEPHMTLLWDEVAVAERAIEPVRWTVSDFVLIHSLHGRSQHVELGRWPLRA